MTKLCLISLGCDKNLVDSELLLGQLAGQKYEFTDDEKAADVIFVNTCCFILDAKEESIETLLRVAEYKHTGHLQKLVVFGCLAERYREEIRKEIPEVDEVFGIQEFEDRLKADPPKKRMLSTGGWYAYLKIADGCDKMCTYCIIPYLRGHYRSVPMDELLRQARDLADAGVRELILVAQETTRYGVDLNGHKMLPELLRQLCAIPGFHWIRILYAYPEEIDDELIRVMEEEPKICHYIDMPIQHASDRILQKMGRRTSRKDIERIIRELRHRIPDICIRTTLITGFPGETEEDHLALMDFVRRMQFERLGCFTYSPEEGTPAERFPDQVAETVKERRKEELMLLQQKISAGIQEGMTGKDLEIIIDGYLPEEKVSLGRSYMDAPEIDGYVFLESGKRHASGDIVRARITGASEYDLTGEEL